jgi:hypothetical protein
VSCHSRGPQAVGPAGGAGGVFFFHSGTSLQNNSPAAFLTTNNGTGEGDFVQRTDRMLAFLGMSGNVDESRSAGLCNPNIICNFDYITLGSSEGNIDDADLLHFQQVLNLEDVDALPGFVYDLNGDSEINAVDLNLLTQFVNGNQSAGETFINPSCDIIQPSFTSDDDNDDGNNDDEELDPTTMTPCEKMMAFGDVAGDIISTSPITYESDPNGVIDHADAVELLQMAISGNFTNDLRFDFNGDGEFNFSDLQFSSDFTNGHIDCDTEEPDPTNMNACEKIIAFGDVAGDVTSLSPLEYNLEPLNGVIDIADNTQMIHMILSGDFTNDIRFDFNGDGVFNFQDLAFVSNFVNGHIDCGDAITLGMHLFHSVNGSSVQCIRDNNALKNKNQNCGSPLLEFQRKLLEGIKKSKSEKLKTNTKGFLSKEEKK